MKLLKASKLVADLPEPELTEAESALLLEEAEKFLAAGGVVTMDVWLELFECEKAAFVTAGNNMRIGQAVRIGQASMGVEGQAHVLAPLDQGEGLAAIKLGVAVAKAAHELASKGPPS